MLCSLYRAFRQSLLQSPDCAVGTQRYGKGVTIIASETIIIPTQTPSTEGIGDPVYTRVRERIRQDILSGHFQPGVRIKMADLSSRYGVSQMPIREALQQLQGEGLVTMAPNRGANVRRVDEALIRNVYDIGIALETLLVRRAIAVSTDSEMFALYGIQTRYEAAVQRGDVVGAIDANLELHDAIYSIAGNPEALGIVRRGKELLHGLRHRFGYGPERLEQIIREHRQLLRALDHRDVALASQTIEEHVEHAKQDLIAQLKLSQNPAHAETGGRAVQDS